MRWPGLAVRFIVVAALYAPAMKHEIGAIRDMKEGRERETEIELDYNTHHPTTTTRISTMTR